MQSQQFRSLSLAERKAKLIQALIAKTGGRLQKEELEAIANRRWRLGYYQGEEFVPTVDFDLVERQMKIVVHDDAKSFGAAATLQRTGMTHSWAGDDTLTQYGNWIIGDGEFGLHKDISHSNNGDIGSPETEDYPPDFNLEQNQVIAVQSVNHNSYNRDSTVHEEEWTLHILFKDAEFPVDPVVAEIMEKFNLSASGSEEVGNNKG